MEVAPRYVLFSLLTRYNAIKKIPFFFNLSLPLYSLFSLFILFKLLYTALTVACMPIDIVREGRVTLIVGLPPRQTSF